MPNNLINSLKLLKKQQVTYSKSASIISILLSIFMTLDKNIFIKLIYDPVIDPYPEI